MSEAYISTLCGPCTYSTSNIDVADTELIFPFTTTSFVITLELALTFLAGKPKPAVLPAHPIAIKAIDTPKTLIIFFIRIYLFYLQLG